MAERFGGKYSPVPQNGTDKAQRRQEKRDRRRVDPAGGRANVMFVPAVVIAFTSFGSGASGLALALIAAALLALSAWLLRDGLRAEAAFNERKIARRPAFPRKIAASLLAGIGIALAAIAKSGDLLGGVLFGVITTALHSVAFGIDPLSDKRIEGIDSFQQDRVARVVDEAEEYLSAITDHIAALKNRPLELRVSSFVAEARELIRSVEEDPRDLTSARKFLGVYLMGARDATVKFCDLYRKNNDTEALRDYEALLTDLEGNFAAKTQKLLIEDRTDVDIEIKVLRDRLQREGVKPQ